MADKIRGQGPEGEMMGDTPDFTDEDLEVADYLLDRRAKEVDGRLDGQASGDRGRFADVAGPAPDRAGDPPALPGPCPIGTVESV